MLSLVSFPTILIVLAILGFAIYRTIRFINKHPTVLLGTHQLLQSPSGVFGLLTLLAITLVTLKQPSVGGTAFAAFCAIIPTALGFFEHKEQMLQMQQSMFSSSPSPPAVMVETAPPLNPAKPNNDPTIA